MMRFHPLVKASIAIPGLACWNAAKGASYVLLKTGKQTNRLNIEKGYRITLTSVKFESGRDGTVFYSCENSDNENYIISYRWTDKNCYMKMETDGRLCIYSGNKPEPLFDSGVKGFDCELIIDESDGRLKVRDRSYGHLDTDTLETPIKSPRAACKGPRSRSILLRSFQH